MNFQRHPTLMKKSVENIFNETQEVIGISINQAISFTNINVLQTSANSSNLSLITGNKNSSNSPTNSPSNSPRVATSSENLLNKSNSLLSVGGLEKSDNKVAEDSLKSVDGLSQTSSDLSSNKSGQSDSVDNKQKSTSNLSERAKKKSWYSALYPSYKSRSEDFKKLFKDVPDSERLVVDYSCALQRDILVHGRLYVSQHYFCFYANIFRWETCLSIKWKEVTAITKEKTARVIPNAICVTTIGEKYFFASFTTRDKAFLMLFRVWQNALMDKPMQPQELWQFVHNSYGDQLGLTTDDEDYIDPSLNTEDSLIKNFSSANKKLLTTDSLSEDQSGNDINLEDMSLESSGDNKVIIMNSQQQQKSLLQQKLIKNSSHEELWQAHEGKRKVTKNNRQRDESLNKNSENLPTDMSNSSDSDDNKNIPFVNTAECTSMHEGRQLVHTILPINIDNLFNILFSESKFLTDFHKVRKSTNMVFGKWLTNEEGVKTRKVNLTIALAQAVGPRSSNVTETQVMRDCSKEGQLYSIDVNSANAGIPYADSFGVKLHYCLVKTVDDHTMLSIHGQIEYKKYIFGVVKGFIERNTWAGLEDFYNGLNSALQSECCIPPGTGNKKGTKGRRPRRSGTSATLKTTDEIILASTTPAEPTLQINVPSPIKILNEPTNQYKWISCFIVFLLFALCIFNVILLIKLNNLEAKDNDIYDSIPDLPLELPQNHKGWIVLLKQQEALHEAEMKKWQAVLQTAIELLKKVSVVCQAFTSKDNYDKNYKAHIEF